MSVSVSLSSVSSTSSCAEPTADNLTLTLNVTGSTFVGNKGGAVVASGLRCPSSLPPLSPSPLLRSGDGPGEGANGASMKPPVESRGCISGSGQSRNVECCVWPSEAGLVGDGLVRRGAGRAGGRRGAQA